jgi:simple sugar transport system ATP-binding protein
MTGKTFDNQVRATPKDHQPVVLDVRSLSRRGQFEDISLTVRRGETLGITGLLGAGRTELALALFGMTKPDSGTIELDGRPVRFSSNRHAIQAGIAYLSEDRLSLGLIQPQSIADNLVISSLRKILSGGFLSDESKESLVAHWIRELGIRIGRQEDAISTLSGGNQQRVAIAKWLATDPKLLILDAPTVGVDVGARAGIFDIVAKLAESGLAIILISDEVPEVYFNADRVLHMAQGRIVGSFDPRQCSLHDIEAAVYA